MSPLVQDFMKIVINLKANNLIKRNISKYDYYIIWLASWRGIKLTNQMISKTIRLEKDTTIIYLVLFDVNCNCKYYIEWLKKQEYNIVFLIFGKSKKMD